MSAEKIINSILEEARREADNIEKQSALNLCEIADSYNSRAERYRAESRQRIDEEKRQAFERAKTAAALDARLKLGNTKKELIDRAFSEACGILGRMDGAQLAEFAVKKAAGPLSAAGAKVLLDKSQADKKEAFAAGLKTRGIDLAVELSDTVRGSGFVVKCGDIEDSFLFESLLREREEALTPEVSAILFED